MKKALLISVFLFFAIIVSRSQTKSTPSPFQPQDGTTYLRSTTEGFSETIKLTVPDTIWSEAMGVPVDSMSVDNISGLPQGYSWDAGCGTVKRCVCLPLSSKNINISSGLSSGTTLRGTYIVTIECSVYSNIFGGGAALPPVSFNYYIEIYPDTEKHNLITSYLTDTISASSSVCNGSAKVTATKGTAPYTYKWDSGETADSISNKCTGNYTIIVTDFLGTKDTLDIFVADSASVLPTPCTMVCPDTATTFIATENEAFFETLTFFLNNNNGQTPPDTLSIDNVTGLPPGITWQTSCGLGTKCVYLQPSVNDVIFTGTPTVVGTYTVIVSGTLFYNFFGATGFPTEFHYTISVFPNQQTHGLITSFSTQNVSSFGLCDGSASVSVTKGTPPYTYQWSSGATSSSISGKCSDKYVVKVSDSQGLKDSIECYIAESVQNIQQPPILYIPIDTLITNYDTCIVDYNLPIDSAFATTFTMLDSTHVSVDFEIYQGGNKIVFNALFSFETAGVNQLNLQLNCKGTFLRMLKSTVINQAIDLQYRQIGTTQNVDHNNFALNIESLNSIENVLIYPNPFSTQTVISITKEIKNASITVIDLLGTVVKTINFSGTQFILEKGDLSSGVYFVQVLSNDIVLTIQKIVIQ